MLNLAKITNMGKKIILTVKQICSNFMVITTNVSGVQIFRIFSVMFTANLGQCVIFSTSYRNDPKFSNR